MTLMLYKDRGRKEPSRERLLLRGILRQRAGTETAPSGMLAAPPWRHRSASALAHPSALPRGTHGLRTTLQHEFWMGGVRAHLCTGTLARRSATRAPEAPQGPSPSPPTGCEACGPARTTKIPLGQFASSPACMILWGVFPL